MADSDDIQKESVCFDGVLATFEIAISKDTSEAWIVEQITDSIKTLGVSHPEAKTIVVLFLK